MEAVFAEINRGANPLMLDYSLFMYDEEGIFVSHYCPSKPLFVGGVFVPGQHPHAASGCCQFFKTSEYSSHAAFLSNYTRMIRSGGSNYLDYYWLADEDPEERKNRQWKCYICHHEECQSDPDMIVESAYYCANCFENNNDDFDICPSCYRTSASCPKCNGVLTLFEP